MRYTNEWSVIGHCFNSWPCLSTPPSKHSKKAGKQKVRERKQVSEIDWPKIKKAIEPAVSREEPISNIRVCFGHP